MYQPISFFIGLRYLWNIHLPKFKKVIIILSILSVSLSISSLIIVFSIINGFQDEFKKNILYFTPHMIITNKSKNINKFIFPKKILNNKEIIKFSNLITHEVIIRNNNSMTMAEILGVDLTNYTDICKYNIKHVLDKLKKGDNHIIIGKKLAEQLHLKLGDTITLMLLNSQDIKLKKSFFHEHKFKINDIFFSNNEIDYYQILINQDEAIKFLHYPQNHITGWRLWFKNPLSINKNKIIKLTHNFIVLDWKIQKKNLFQAINIEKYIMILFLILIILILSFNIMSNLMLYITEKKNDIAILKTQGLTNWKIMLIFIILGSTTTIIGIILGIIFSLYLIFQKKLLLCILNVFSNHNNIIMMIDTSQIILISNISILFTLFLTLYPAWTIIKLQPVKILHNNE
ncbi:FtsX-like permease family protein [Buchnera aphidicola]|uniref:FtsX-like permease family protein n=1 Tax=Buchnera aphidicola TaxID=9 RepID=UPI003BEECBEB